jgi:hypothetical protein
MRKDELIKKLNEHHCPVCRDCHILEAVDQYVLSRENAILSEIEKPLKEALEYAWDSHTRIAELQWYKESIDEALAIIQRILEAK